MGKQKSRSLARDEKETELGGGLNSIKGVWKGIYNMKKYIFNILSIYSHTMYLITVDVKKRPWIYNDQRGVYERV